MNPDTILHWAIDLSVSAVFVIGVVWLACVVFCFLVSAD